jgi:hypothetical protein
MLKVLNNYIYDDSFKEAVEAIVNGFKGNQEKNFCISATDTHCLVYSKKQDIRFNIDFLFLNLPDRMPCVGLGNLILESSWN